MSSDLRAFCGAALGTADVAITPRPPTAFQSNALFDVASAGKHYIAKVYLKPREWDEAPHREYLGLKLVEHLDIAPRAVAIKAAPDPAVLYEYVPGQAWDRRAPQPGDLRALFGLLLRVHGLNCTEPRLAHRPILSIGFDNCRVPIERYVAWCDAHHPSGRATAALVMRCLDDSAGAFDELHRAAYTPCFTKPDLRFANVVARPDGRLALVDWEDSMMGDPAFDLADLITAPNQEDLVTWRDWAPLWEWHIAAHNDPDLARRARLYVKAMAVFWLTLVGKGVRLVEAGQAPHFDVNSMPSEQRLRRFLARALAPTPEAFEQTLAHLPETCFFPA